MWCVVCMPCGPFSFPVNPQRMKVESKNQKQHSSSLLTILQITSSLIVDKLQSVTQPGGIEREVRQWS